MDEKTALVIGTSHSYASCDGARIKHPDRWQDNLENHGYKVTTFSRPGCTAEHQLDAFFYYMLDSPSYWDLIIIEGRDVEASVSYPAFNPTKNQDTKNIWHHWIHDEGDRIKKFNFTNEDHENSRTTKWYKEYQGSHLHLVNTWATNSALCTLASKYATIVKWFTFGSIIYPENYQNKSEHFQNMLLGEYCITDTFPALQQTFDVEGPGGIIIDNMALSNIFKKGPGSETRCECGHLNKVGHKMLWDNVLEPALIKDNVL
jgi:hypothetical protein